jgi:hypothetical protein
MEVSEVNTGRFRVALEVLKEGKEVLTFNDVDFWVYDRSIC